jgi:DASH complex subunit ASK1
MNPLQQHPFRIPGVNPELPVNQQIEQIEQLNTLLLQEIDANFAKFHQTIISRILPQIKRYAIAAEPVREGAKVG